jgi:hypothetical protein
MRYHKRCGLENKKPDFAGFSAGKANLKKMKSHSDVVMLGAGEGERRSRLNI